MVQRPLVVRDRVLVVAKTGEVVFDKPGELCERTLARGRPGGRGRVVELALHVPVDLIAFVFEVSGPHVVLWRGQSIVGVKVPTAPFRCTVDHENSESHALLAIEVLHDKRLLCGGPLGKGFSAREEEIVVNELNPKLRELLRLPKR